MPFQHAPTATKEYLVELNEILEEVNASDARTCVLLEAGHHYPNREVGEFSVQSLVDALSLLDALVPLIGNKARFALGILLDDLGITAEGPQPEFSKQQIRPDRLPQPLQDVLAASSKVKPESLLIMSERNAKNRAIEFLRRSHTHSSNLLRIHDSETEKLMLARPNGQSIELATFGKPNANAKWPAIMGKHYDDCLRILLKRFPDTEQAIIVDWSEMMDLNKVTAGVAAFHEVFQSSTTAVPCDVINVFFAEPSGMLSQVNHTPAPQNN